MSTALMPTPAARCERCHATTHLVEGDGPVICRPCLMLLGRCVRDPFLVSSRLREMLVELHADVVVLVETSGPLAIMWNWIAPWPGVEPRAET